MAAPSKMTYEAKTKTSRSSGEATVPLRYNATRSKADVLRFLWYGEGEGANEKTLNPKLQTKLPATNELEPPTRLGIQGLGLRFRV